MSAAPQLHLHPNAVSRNIAALRRHIRAHDRTTYPPRLWAVAKADAYGHGLREMLPGLRTADGLAVSRLDDIYLCRTQGWSGPILYLATDDTIDALADPSLGPLHVVLSTIDQVTRLHAWRSASDRHVWLRFAGALNHAGFKANEYVCAYRQLDVLLKQGRIATLGHLQHYAYAEDPTHLDDERTKFSTLIKALPGPVCSENSVALLASPEFSTKTAWVRSGIVLYGVNPLLPSNTTPSDPLGLALQPAMTLRAPVYAVQHLAPGEGPGYACTFRAPHAMRIGLVRCGYADGYPRQLLSPCPCRVAGKPTRVIGRVAMDTLSIDLTPYPEIGIGSTVSLWGEYDISVQAVAHSANTIAAQLLTGITQRVQRYYPGDPGYAAPQT